LNAQMGPIAQFHPGLLDAGFNAKTRLGWVDEKKSEMLAMEQEAELDLCLQSNVKKVTKHYDVNPKSLRTAMKVS